MSESEFHVEFLLTLNFSGRFNLVRICITRYLRLIPVIGVITLLFTTSLPKFMVEGPNYHQLDSVISGCREWWFRTLLFDQDFADDGSMV